MGRIVAGDIGGTNIRLVLEVDGAEVRRDVLPTGGWDGGHPVSVEFDDQVPVQMVVNLLDICTRLGITEFTLAAKEQPIP